MNDRLSRIYNQGSIVTVDSRVSLITKSLQTNILVSKPMVLRRSTKRAAPRKSEPAPEERSFVNPSSVSLHLFCPICQEAFSNPQRAPCGHSFCKSCIDPWIRDSPTCPVDRLPIPKGSMHHDFIVENIIGEYMVSCPWRSLGCDFIGRLCVLPSHKKTCPMNPELLPAELRNRVMAGLQNTTTNRNQSSDLNCYSYNEKLSKARQEPAPPYRAFDDFSL
ncbi:unnamed protein product [Trichobilharzia szidati]|nr:unnamed protein product [Trichobilharzia szidati]